MADKDNVAATTIEIGDKRIAPGERIPADFPDEDLDELRKYGSIVSRDEYNAMRDEDQRRRTVVSVTLGAIEDALGDKKHPLREIVRGETGNTSDGRG